MNEHLIHRSLDLGLYLAAMAIALGGVWLNLFSLPGNWLLWLVALGLNLLASRPGVTGLVVLTLILLAAEGAEFLGTLLGARQFGADRWAMTAALLGSLVGGIMGFPLPVIGNLIGAVLGAFLATLLVEWLRARGAHQSLRSALGAALGRAIGLGAKIGGGMAAWLILAWSAWPL